MENTKKEQVRKIYAEIGKRVVELRDEQQCTRKMLADSIGVSDKFLYELEKGRKGISAANLYYLSKALGVSADYLLTGR